MKRRIIVAFVLGVAIFSGLVSCKNDAGINGHEGKNRKGDALVEGEAVVLNIGEAELIQVDNNPQYNTAEWLFRVEKPGRWDVWLSSLTIDTSQLHFAENVIITAGETKLEKKPVSDRVVTDDKSFSGPWYRADTHMGSVFFSKPGEYQVQVISDKVEPHCTDLSQLSIDKHTLINSVILKPKFN